MIKKLKIKFVLLAMVTIFSLLAVILVGMNLINYNSVVNEADKTLSFLSQNKGTFPETDNKPDVPLPPNMSPETPHEARYFSVLLDSNGDAISVNTNQIISVSQEQATIYAQSIKTNNKTAGFVDNFRYIVKNESDGIRVTFLDCGRTLDAYYNFLYTSLFMGFIGFVVASLIIFIISSKIIKPIAESYTKQKQFITDAGHEIKTPLTIINANTDILEMDVGENNECLMDIKMQTKRLRCLTDDLMMLSRMEESENTLQKIYFPISEVVTETVHPFYNLALSQNKLLTCHIEPLLSINGNNKAIAKLVSLLLDNALKYSTIDSEIKLSLTKQNHALVLSVINQIENDLNVNNLERLFDRFYREDLSHNSETGGYGIGLSIAKAIVIAHNGKIVANKPQPKTFQITASFPEK